MKLRFDMAALLGMLLFASLSFADEPLRRDGPEWNRQPGTPVSFETAGFNVRMTLPHGWTLKDDREFVPPPNLAPSCRVRGEIYTGRNWNEFLAMSLSPSNDLDRSTNPRTLHTLNDRPAVTNRFSRKDERVVEVYVNLSGVQADSGAMWTFEGRRTDEGNVCELQFLTLVHSATIRRAQ